MLSQPNRVSLPEILTTPAIAYMKKRLFHFSCDDQACKSLAKIISTYAHTAFPIGGSECAQATRESLLDMANRLAICNDESFALNPRQRPMLKSAINWYFSEVVTDQLQHDNLLNKLKR